MKQLLKSLFGAMLAVLVSIIALPAQADPGGLEPSQASKKVLMVISSNGREGGKAAPGYEFEEFSAAYLVFSANGIEVDVASPSGGTVESDPYDPDDPVNARVLADAGIMARLENSLPLAQLSAGDYDAIFIVGGKGAMFDFHDNPHLQAIIGDTYSGGGIVAAVCHGPAALVNVKLADGTYLVDGKRVNGFTNAEERLFGQRWMPDFEFLLEDRLVERGGLFESAPMMLSHVARDGRLITGQNPASTPHVAEKVVRMLGIVPVDRPVGPMERTYALLKTVIEQGPHKLESYQAEPDLFNGSLIAMYGFFTARTAQSSHEHERAIAMMSVQSAVRDRPQLRLELARSWLQLGNLDRARAIVDSLLEADPSNEGAKTLAASLN